MTGDGYQPLPNGWVWTTLGEVCDPPQYGWTTKASATAYGPKLLRTTDITRGSINWDIVPSCTQAPPDIGHYRLRPGDILISRAGSVGASILIGDCPQAVFASYLIRFRPVTEVHRRYISYFLRSPHYWGSISQASAGIALQNVNARKLASVRLPLAPVPEQHRIVAEIEKHFTRLDAAVASLERARANLKRYRASVLRAACEGRLVPTEAELARREGREHEPASVLLEQILEERRPRWEAQPGHRGKYKEPKPPDTSNLPPLPEGWVWARLEQCTSFITSGSRNWAVHYADSGPLFIRAADIRTDRLKLEEVARVHLPGKIEGLRTRVQQADLLITITGANVTRTAYVREPIPEAYVSQHIGLVRPLLGDCASYLYYWTIAPSHGRAALLRYAYGAGKPGLSLDNLREFIVGLPPLAEQQRIVAEVERHLSVIQAAQNVVEANLKRAERLRQAILKRAFEGKLVPQDSTDDPASVLLERIRKEREQAEGNISGTRRRTGRRSKPQEVSA